MLNANRKPKRRRTYNTRLLREDYSYYVEQIADLFGIEVAAVRRWIREEGLKRIPHARPHLVHSSDLKSFLDKKQAKRKKPCAPNEAFCLRCQLPRLPVASSGSVIQLPSSIIRFRAKCGVCGLIMNRSIKGEEWSQNHPLAAFLHNATEEHIGVQSMHCE